MSSNPIRESLGLSHRHCITSTRRYLPKIKVDVIGSKPNASPKGFARSPAIAFPKTNVHPHVLDAIGALTLVVPFSPLARVPSA